jgi:hypothetical protein
MIWPQRHSVYPIFAEAGHNWHSGCELYQHGTSDPFRYSPFVAALFAPLSFLPDHLGGVLWRSLGLGVYLGAFTWWTRRVTDKPLSASQRALLFLLLLPLSVGALNNGQSNLLLMGLLLAACAAAMAGRWNLSSLCIALAFLFKVYPLAMGLLLLLLYPRRFWWRLPAVITVGLLLPFLLQDPSYVSDQYAGWLAHLQDNDRQLNTPSTEWYRDLRQLWSLWISPMDYGVYQLVAFCAGAALAGLCVLRLRARGLDRRLHVLTFSLGCCWMTVCGPATESATYVFLAPAAAWAVLSVYGERPAYFARVLILAGYGLLVLSQIVVWFPIGRAVHSLGPQPIAGLLLTGGFLAIDWTGRPESSNQLVPESLPARAA